MFDSNYNYVFDAIEKEAEEAIKIKEGREALQLFQSKDAILNTREYEIKREAFNYARSFLRDIFISLRKQTIKE